jgi:hypothetical protein
MQLTDRYIVESEYSSYPYDGYGLCYSIRCKTCAVLSKVKVSDKFFAAFNRSTDFDHILRSELINRMDALHPDCSQDFLPGH